MGFFYRKNFLHVYIMENKVFYLTFLSKSQFNTKKEFYNAYRELKKIDFLSNDQYIFGLNVNDNVNFKTTVISFWVMINPYIFKHFNPDTTVSQLQQNSSLVVDKIVKYERGTLHTDDINITEMLNNFTRIIMPVSQKVDFYENETFEFVEQHWTDDLKYFSWSEPDKIYNTRKYFDSSITVDTLLQYLHDNKNFSYIRYNDGEWFAIRGYSNNNSSTNCDGQRYDTVGPELWDQLKSERVKKHCDSGELIIESNSMIGYGWSTWETFLEKIHIKFQKVNFLDEILSDYPRKMINFFEILKNKHIILIGPYYLKKVRALNIQKFIEVPTTNCYDKIDEIEETLINSIPSHTKAVVLIAAGMATNILVIRLLNKNINQHTLIDVGSGFDVFVKDERSRAFRFGLKSKKYRNDIRPHLPDEYFDW